jgi:branched-subunit amino acid transport protein
MSPATIVLIGLAGGTYALKAAAPVLLGDRPLPDWLGRLADLFPAALLGALVTVSAFTSDSSLTVDARAAGLLAAVVALWRKAPFVVVVLAAGATTALVRALGGG